MITLIEKEKPFLDKFLDRTALRIEEIIKSHKIRDWTQSQDVTNHILIRHVAQVMEQDLRKYKHTEAYQRLGLANTFG